MGRLILALAVCMTSAVAATPAGSITSSGRVELSGISVDARLLPSLPVVLGDEIATSKDPAVLVLLDRSRLILDANSRVKLDAKGGRTVVQVLEGAVNYSLTSSSTTEVVTSGSQATPKSGTRGLLAVGNRTPAPSVLGSGFFKGATPFRTVRTKSCPAPQPKDDACVAADCGGVCTATCACAACDNNCGLGNN
ncbi:MAG TPA: hypothetical protein VFA54_06585 [Bryobacterales bacterium]|jgi:ferric-dicitrate binding protein FerR (iron transport regulator)|nr:hypothetical protein [Bryobacterales bacterium]